MKKAALFEERIANWAKLNGIVVKDMDFIDSTEFYYIDIDQPVLYWRELKELEFVCGNMGIEIYDIMQSIESKDGFMMWTIWLC